MQTSISVSISIVIIIHHNHRQHNDSMKHVVWPSTPVQVIDRMSGDRPELKCPRPRGRHRQTWICQLEVDVGLAADAAWVMANDCDIWRMLRTVAGKVVH